MSISETIPVGSPVVGAVRRIRPADLPALPTVAPGQLWLVELPIATSAPCASARHAVDGANVIVYDRALAERLADLLPLGSYAEAAPSDDGVGDRAVLRCVGFARDGWSVVRLLPARLPQRARGRRLRDLVDELASAGVPGALPVVLLAESGDGIRERADTRLDRLGETVATYSGDTQLTILIDAFGAAAGARLQAIAANGPAG